MDGSMKRYNAPSHDSWTSASQFPSGWLSVQKMDMDFYYGRVLWVF